MKWLLRRRKASLERKLAGMEEEYKAVLSIWNVAGARAKIPWQVVNKTLQLPHDIAVAKKELEQINDSLS